MNKQAAAERIAKLKKEINHHRYLYHVLDTEDISQAALDSLKHELAQLEQKFPDLVTSDSPTQRVGGQPLPKFKKVQHRTPMLSLTDAFSLEELEAWEERNKRILARNFEYFTELKIDGVAVSLIYENGLLIQGATRGNGREGEDVTQNLRTIDAIPLQLREAPGIRRAPRIEIRGEVYMLKKDFVKMNKQRQKEGKALFANPRNVSAGSIRQLDPALTAARPLRFFAWEITEGIELTTRQEEYDNLKELGLPVPPEAQLFANLKELENFLNKEAKRRLKRLFQVDGLVLKINNLADAKRLGIIGKAPRGSIAFKFAAEEATTIVEDIVVQVGRTGALTPVAHLQPVSVAGTTVSRATLHNADEIQRKDVRVGDTVIIHKAGDIIPEVVKVLLALRPKGAKAFRIPTKCPVCGSPVSREDGGTILRCTNRDCFPQRHAHIIHAIGRDGFDIDGLGDKIVEQLLQEGLIEDAPDLWDLTEGDLTPLERFAEKSAKKLVEEIQAHKDIELPAFLVALGVPQVGVVTAQDLAREFGTLEKIQKASLEELNQVEGIGPKVALAAKEFFEGEAAKKVISKYKKAGIHIKPAKVGGPLKGKVFVFTGSLGDISRDEAKQRVIALGGKVASTVGEKVTHVVVGEDPGSKAKKAKELGLTIITPEQFQKMLK